MTLTKKEQLVLDVLNKEDAPLGAYALLDRLRGEGFSAPVQIYRPLTKLQALGLVHRLESLNAYAACSLPGGCRGSAAFIICENCGAFDELKDSELQGELVNMASRQGFSLRSATIELHGICGRCAESS
ncbi:Fur family transcriptional regulator [Halomonas halocynthiae]|uniref:Fur family transcriptional regulator n=1 Tax=Halomonas halocynthiae TaxID=176290 RepID=UPI000481FE9F|nr:Fur family transcriptional regulator [Halomonas halocynthiae]